MNHMPISDLHEQLLYEEIRELESQGWRVLDIRHTLPDAIAVSPDNRIVAIEVLGRKRRTDRKGKSKGYQWDGGKGVRTKRWLYQKYDDIIFVLFDRGGSGWRERLVASEAWPDIKPKGAGVEE